MRNWRGNCSGTVGGGAQRHRNTRKLQYRKCNIPDSRQRTPRTMQRRKKRQWKHRKPYLLSQEKAKRMRLWGSFSIYVRVGAKPMRKDGEKEGAAKPREVTKPDKIQNKGPPTPRRTPGGEKSADRPIYRSFSTLDQSGCEKVGAPSRPGVY